MRTHRLARVSACSFALAIALAPALGHADAGSFVREARHEMMIHGVLFLLGLICMGASSERWDAMRVAFIREPGKTIAVGAASYLAALVGFIALMITLIGIPFALALLLLVPALTYVGLGASASLVGAALPSESLRDRPVSQLAAGVAVLFAVSLVPYLGALVTGLAACSGMGMLVRAGLRKPNSNFSRGVEAGPYRTAIDR